MTSLDIGIASLVAIFGLVYAGLWIPFALLVCSFVGVWLIKGSPVVAGKLMALAAQSAISSEVFAIIPLFIMLGFLVRAAGIGKDALDLSEVLFQKLPAGSGVGIVGANALFAAMTGVSVASASVFTRISAGPMVALGYRLQFVLGLVAGSSVLGMLIPPSLLLILYGILTDQPVGALFLAGIVPGVILACALGCLVIVMAKIAPGLVWYDAKPAPALPEYTSRRLISFGPLVLLCIAALGGITSGFFTTQEAAAFGCLLAFIILLARKGATLATLQKILSDTAAVTASLCFVIIAAQVYARMLSLSGVPSSLVDLVLAYDLSDLSFVLLYVVILIVFGTILDSASVMILVVPIALPLAIGLDFNLIWLGIVTVIAIEIGLLTPPFGMSIFAIKATLENDQISVDDIFRGALPFLFVILLVLFLVILFPALSLAFI